MMDFDKKARGILAASKVAGDGGGWELSEYHLLDEIVAALKEAYNAGRADECESRQTIKCVGRLFS